MKKKSILLIIIVLLSLSTTLFAEDNSCDLAQYDFLTNQVIIEPIFGFFTIATSRPLAQGTKCKIKDSDIEKWYEIKPELEKIANQENNERNADAFLILACGKWLFENKTNEAINMAKSVVNKYPNATTILTVNFPNSELSPLKLNHNFYFYFYDLFRSKTIPLSKRKQIYELSRNKFITHLIEHPMSATDVAKVLEYHLTGDINLLKEIMQNHPYSEMKKDMQCDKEATESEYGQGFYDPLNREIHFERNEIIVAKYLSYADKQDGLATFEKVVEAISDDGFYWWINEILGYKFNAQHDYSKAEKQYKLALKGYYNTIRNKTLYFTTIHSKKTRSRKKLNTVYWQGQITRLKKKIKEVGGQIELNTDECKSLQDIYEIKVTKPGPNEFSKEYFIENLKKIYKKENQFSEPENIRKEINEFTDAFSNRVALINEENKKDLLEQGRFIAICLTQLAGNESDTETKETALAGIRKIINVEKVDRNITVNESTKKKVDGYIAQIIGIGKVERPVPYPDTNLFTMDSPALLYAAEFALVKELSIENKRKIICVLANSDNPILFDFFNDLLLESEDSKIRRFASWGLERIIRKHAKDIDDNGKIILKK
ncbi:hypothetical protein KAH27_09490 [bacterium]|nr:hypothetical protein [bacterium]